MYLISSFRGVVENRKCDKDGDNADNPTLQIVVPMQATQKVVLTGRVPVVS